MPKFIKHQKYSDGFETAASGTTSQPFSYRERLEALTQIYLDLSLPLQVAFRAAEADLCQLDVGECSSCYVGEAIELSGYG